MYDEGGERAIFGASKAWELFVSPLIWCICSRSSSLWFHIVLDSRDSYMRAQTLVLSIVAWAGVLPCRGDIPSRTGRRCRGRHE